jgi:hypothetical protein
MTQFAQTLILAGVRATVIHGSRANNIVKSALDAVFANNATYDGTDDPELEPRIHDDSTFFNNRKLHRNTQMEDIRPLVDTAFAFLVLSSPQPCGTFFQHHYLAAVWIPAYHLPQLCKTFPQVKLRSRLFHHWFLAASIVIFIIAQLESGPWALLKRTRANTEASASTASELPDIKRIGTIKIDAKQHQSLETQA